MRAARIVSSKNAKKASLAAAAVRQQGQFDSETENPNFSVSPLLLSSPIPSVLL
jgi:hypothetical protein